MGTVELLLPQSATAQPHVPKHIAMRTHVHSGLTHNYTTVSRWSDLMVHHPQTQTEKRSIPQEVMLQSTVTGTLTKIHTEIGTQQVTVFRANRVGALC